MDVFQPLVRSRIPLGVVLALTLVASPAFPQANGRLHLHFMNVGQGDGALLISPAGQTVLFDSVVRKKNALRGARGSADIRFSVGGFAMRGLAAHPELLKTFNPRALTYYARLARVRAVVEAADLLASAVDLYTLRRSPCWSCQGGSCGSCTT